MTETNETKYHTCSRCGARNEEQQAIANEYKCTECGHELAHLDMAPNGAIRGIFDWLKEKQAEIGGRYQVETVLGKGGFGATYLVSDQRVHGKRWALKEIPEMLFDEYEVSLLSQLDHPAVPIIVDRFTDAGMVYLVLKFGGTKTLASECKQNGKIPYDRLKPWALQIGDVLNYLHGRNPPIIHRDLKPENILIDDQNRVMLIDFGIAKESVAQSATRTLGRAASHGFSPPEQVMGTGTDVRSDIYSFAATIYFALTGKTPVAAHERVAGAVLPALEELVPTIPAEVNMIVMKALNLNLNERPQTIADFLKALTGSGSTTADRESGSTKTVQISDIQFGPVIKGSATSAKQTRQSHHAPAASRNTSMIVGIAASVVVLSLGGAYWVFKDDKPADETAIVKPAVAPIPDTPPAVTAVVPPPPVSGNAPSALDILNEELKSKQPLVDEPKKAEPSAEDRLKAAAAQRAREEKARKAAAERANSKSQNQPNWGNQRQGSF